MVTKTESRKNEDSQKIAAFVASYSNKGTGAGYKNAIESFLRCKYSLPKKDNDGKRYSYDYETLFSQYLADKTKNPDEDFVKYAVCLKAECKSNQSARQQMTYARRMLEDHGVKVKDKVSRDLKREMKGSAGTVDKVMTSKVIDAALQEMDVKGRALVLTLVSSGARLNEILSLKIEDIDFNASPVTLTLRRTKNQNTRFTFISTEAVRCIQAWLKQRDQYLQTASGRIAGLVRAGICKDKDTDSDLLFPFTDSAVNQVWENALKASGQFSQDTQTGRNQLRIHSFRKFFISQLSMAGQKTLAEHLAGHEGYLDGSYRRIDVEQAGQEYLKVMHVVTIGIPEEFKKNHNELRNTMQIQGESIEGLRAKNERLESIIRRMEESHQSDIQGLKEQMSVLITVLKAEGFTSVKGAVVDVDDLK